jgi:hypothetical protein
MGTGRELAALVLLAGLAAGCSADDEPAAAGTRPGCGLVLDSAVVGLLGRRVDATLDGSLRALRRDRRRATCRAVAHGRSGRSVTVTAAYHPRPVALPATGCSEGWVYAGTPSKYAPACQQAVGTGGRTRLVVRWQPYVMHVTIDRLDRAWGGDAEVALSMTRVLAQRLGVREAAGPG